MACLRMLALVPAGTEPPKGNPPPGGSGAGSRPESAAAPVAASTSITVPAVATDAAPASTTSAAAAANLATHAPSGTSVASANAVSAIAPTMSAAKDASRPDAVAAPRDIPAWEDAPAEADTALAIAEPHGSDIAQAVDAPPEIDAGLAVQPHAEAEADAQSTADSGPSDDAGPSVEDDFEAFHGRRFESGDDDDAGRYEPVGAGEGDFETMGEAMEELAAPVFATTRKKSGTPRVRDMTGHAWPALAASLPLTGLAAELARQSEWLGADGDQINLRVAIKSLAESPGKSRLCTVLSEHFGTVVQVHVEYGATGDETAHAVAQAQKARRQHEAEVAVANDPFIKTLIAEFDARVVDGSISATPHSKAA
jgi:DNA polymerase-3 subunit gamma/tau